MATGETAIRTVIEGWVDAVRRKDAAALSAKIGPDAVLFDLVEPLQSRGADSVRQRAAAWLGSFDGVMEYEVAELNVTAGADVGFCHGLNHVKGTTRQGTKIDMWWRSTVGFRKVNGEWLVTHEHSSSPFDMATGKVNFGLQP